MCRLCKVWREENPEETSMAYHIAVKDQIYETRILEKLTPCEKTLEWMERSADMAYIIRGLEKIYRKKKKDEKNLPDWKKTCIHILSVIQQAIRV